MESVGQQQQLNEQTRTWDMQDRERRQIKN